MDNTTKRIVYFEPSLLSIVPADEIEMIDEELSIGAVEDDTLLRLWGGFSLLYFSEGQRVGNHIPNGDPTGRLDDFFELNVGRKRMDAQGRIAQDSVFLNLLHAGPGIVEVPLARIAGRPRCAGGRAPGRRFSGPRP